MLQKNGVRSKTVLVAGGAGFLGSHLCEELLAAGHRVLCLDSFLTSTADNVSTFEGNRGFRMIRHDICEAVEVDEPIDQVYNLACPASPPLYQVDPLHTMLTSVVGTANLLKLAQHHGASFLQASTSEVYGDPEEHPQREDYWGHVNCTGPRACYDEGKRAAEALCFDSLRNGSVDVRVARIFNTYGPRMQADDGRIVSNLVTQALTGKPLTVYGSGAQTRSFCYVSDLIRGLVALMDVEPNPGAPVNLGNPDEFTIAELAGMVQQLASPRCEMVYRPLPVDDPRRRRPDIRRARELLGWTPEVRLSDGLSRTIAWFQNALGAEVRPSGERTGPASSRSPQPIAASTE